MSLTSSAIRVAGTGELYVAKIDAGATAPTGTGSSLATTWKALGYTSDDGVSIGRSVNREEIRAWQSASPVRFVYSEQAFTVSCTLLQSEAEVAGLWLGADFEANSTEWKAEGSAIPTGQEYMIVVHWEDDTVTNRLYVPRCEVTEQGEISLNRTSATGFQVTFSALAPTSGPLFSWFSNDSNMDPSA